MNSPDTPPDTLHDAAQKLRTRSHLFYEHTAHQHHQRRQSLRANHLTPAQKSSHTVTWSGTSCYAWQPDYFGHAATQQTTPSALANVIDTACTYHQSPHPNLNLNPSDATPSLAVMQVMEAVSDAAFGWDARVTATQVHVLAQQRRTAIWTPNHDTGMHRTIHERIRLEVTLTMDGTSWTGQAIGQVDGDMDGQPEFLAREAVENAHHRATARPVQPGIISVVFAPGWGGIWLHELIGHSLEADQWNPAHFPLGTQIGASFLNVYDDAALPGGRATAPFDDEGTATQRTPLIINGILQNLLTDARNAERLNQPCTGNGRRQDFRYPPLPRMTNLVLAPGPHQPEDLFAQIKGGLYITHVDHGSIRPDLGTFALEVSAGFRLKDGAISHPIQPVRLTGRTADLLHQIGGVGNDFKLDTVHGTCEKAGQVVPISVGQPTILFSRMKVASV